MMYFDHQFRSSWTPWVRLRACEMVEIKRVPEINPENNSDVRQNPARAGHDHAGGLRVENLLHLRVGRQKAFQDPSI